MISPAYFCRNRPMPRDGDTVQERVSDLYGRTDYADVIIKYGNDGKRIFNGHRSIICSFSGYFRKSFEGGYREASTRVIDLSASKGYDTDAVESILAYMYTDDYPRESRQQTAPPTPIIDPLVEMAATIRSQTETIPIQLNGTGNTPKPPSTFMPGVVGVGTARRETSQREPDLDLNDVDPLLHVKVYKLADQFQMQTLKEVAQRKLQEHLRRESNAERFAELCSLIYDPDYILYSDRGLRDLIVQMYREQNELFLSQPVQEMLESVQELDDELCRVEQGLPPASDDS